MAGVFGKRVFGRPRKTSSKPASVPPDTRVYAVGDIHGRHDLLDDLHRQIAADGAGAPERRRVLVYLGDYVDRGMGSRQVLDRLVHEPLAGFERVFLEGNHEAVLLDFLHDASVGQGWLFYGGYATLASYGIAATELNRDPHRLRQLQDAFRAALPTDHLSFLRALRPMHREGDYLFVHAGIRPGVPLERQTPEDLFWIREDFLESSDPYECVVVHGHTIVPGPDIRANRIGIDTGAFATGRLTCLVLTGAARRFMTT